MAKNKREDPIVIGGTTVGRLSIPVTKDGKEYRLEDGRRFATPPKQVYLVNAAFEFVRVEDIDGAAWWHYSQVIRTE